jgi:hypothetical protein
MMRSAGLLSAVVIATLVVLPSPSLAQQSKWRAPQALIPGGAPLFALPDLKVKVENMMTKCVAPYTLDANFNVVVYNVGDGPAIMPKNVWGQGPWVRVSDMYSTTIDGFVPAPPWSLLPGKTMSSYMNMKIKQVCQNGCSWVYTHLRLTVDPQNSILETSEANNVTDLPFAHDNKKGQSLCK